jgi:hypothetical protein
MPKPLVVTAMIVGAVALAGPLTGCEALIGGGVGAAGSAGGYEYHLNQEKQRVENDYKAGKIQKQEYDTRLDQIRRDSLLQ